jgi:hypothetical protein
MASSYTYTTLKAALLAFVEETATDDYATDIDKIIPLAEDRVLRELDLELFDLSYNGNFTGGNAYLTKPTGLLSLRTMHYTDAQGNMQLLEPRSWAVCKDYWPKESTTTSTPRYFAEFSDTSWFIAGTPASALVATIRCIVRPAGMASGNLTTWLGTNVGDLLFYACLVGSEQYLKADERIGMWKTEYAERLQAARFELKPETRKDYTPVDPAPTV